MSFSYESIAEGHLHQLICYNEMLINYLNAREVVQHPEVLTDVSLKTWSWMKPHFFYCLWNRSVYNDDDDDNDDYLPCLWVSPTAVIRYFQSWVSSAAIEFLSKRLGLSLIRWLSQSYPAFDRTGLSHWICSPSFIRWNVICYIMERLLMLMFQPIVGAGVINPFPKRCTSTTYWW